MSTSRVFVCGDTHFKHDIRKLRAFRDFGMGAKLTKNDFVIVCGDFGLLFSSKRSLDWKREEGKSIDICPEDTNWSDEEIDMLHWYNELPWTTLFVDG